MLTRDFTCKILEILARWRSRLQLIMVGESGVGKTRALRIFTRLLEASVEVRPQILQELYDEMRRSLLEAKEQGAVVRGVEEAMDRLLEEGFTPEGFKEPRVEPFKWCLRYTKGKRWRSLKLFITLGKHVKRRGGPDNPLLTTCFCLYGKQFERSSCETTSSTLREQLKKNLTRSLGRLGVIS